MLGMLMYFKYTALPALRPRPTCLRSLRPQAVSSVSGSERTLKSRPTQDSGRGRCSVCSCTSSRLRFLRSGGVQSAFARDAPRSFHIIYSVSARLPQVLCSSRRNITARCHSLILQAAAGELERDVAALNLVAFVDAVPVMELDRDAVLAAADHRVQSRSRG